MIVPLSPTSRNVLSAQENRHSEHRFCGAFHVSKHGMVAIVKEIATGRRALTDEQLAIGSGR
jgi:hypothetical protein